MGIAELPLQMMQTKLQTFNSQASALSGLKQDFTSLQTALQSVETAMGSGSYAATSSDSSLVSATATDGALEGTYTIAVSDPGSHSSSVSNSSLPAVADPTKSSISTSSDFTLTAGANTFDIKPANNTLTSLAEAINNSGAGVQASLVNTGSSTSPQYRVVLSSTSLGPVSIQLNDGSQDLLGSLNTGTLASYTVNGMGSAIQSSSSTVTLEPGLTVDLLQSTPANKPVTVGVSRDLTSAGSALSSFVSAYNTVVNDLNQQVGQNAGALSGSSIVGTLRETLRQITQYDSGSGVVSSLPSLGLSLDSTGQLSFDSSTINFDSVDEVQTFLGSTDSGGFLKAANDALNSALDSTSGTLTMEVSATNDEITQENSTIADENQKLTDLQNNLDQQMSAADTLIASLESQKSYFENLFTSMMNEKVTSSS